MHNTQIARYLDQLLEVGHALRSGVGHAKRYRLTRGGLMAMVESLVAEPVPAPLEQFFFIYYFVRNYGVRLTELVSQKEFQLPKSVQIELQALLSTEDLLSRQMKYVQLEIRKLESRIAETKGAAKLARDLSSKGRSSQDIISSVEQLYPYDLNSVKPMGELLHEVPAALRVWELTSGNESRAQILWSPFKEYLVRYLSVLEELDG